MPQSIPSFGGNYGDAPIHRLPPEILAEIVTQCTESETHLRDLVRLTGVCKRWRVILEDASFLWGTINADEGAAIVGKALERAKNTPLDLGFDENASKIDRETFFKSIGKRMDQWRSLDVALNSCPRGFVLDYLGKRRPPNLEVLHLRGDAVADSSREGIILFGGDSAPSCMKEFALGGIPINLSSLRFGPSLKSLHLSAISKLPSVDIIKMIVASPLLEHIQLTALRSLTDSITPPHETGYMHDPPIRLAHLTHLGLFELSAPFINLVLSTISAPQLRALDLYCEMEEEPVTELLSEGMRHQVPTLTAMISNIQTFTIVIGSYSSYEIIIGGLQIAFSVPESDLIHFKEMFDWISNHLGRPLKDLPLHLDIEDCDVELSWLEWFTRRANVTELDLGYEAYVHDGPALERLIRYLSRPTRSSPGTWPVPQVEILKMDVIQGSNNLDIVEMIKRRHSAASVHDLEVVAPKPFREIWFSYGEKEDPDCLTMSPDFLGEVQRVAPDTELYWEGQRWMPS